MVVWNIIQTDKRPATAWDIMLDAALRPGLPPFPGQRAPFGSGVIGVKRKTLKEQGWYHTPAHRKWRKLVMQSLA
jgi:hypothetical protein